MKNFIGKYWFMLIAALALLIVLSMNLSAAQQHRKDIEVQQTKIAELRNKLDLLKASKTDVDDQLHKTVTGADNKRKAADDKTIEGLLRLATTWDSWKDYTGNREQLIRTYGISEDTQFLKTYMPTVKQTDAGGGKYINVIDSARRNMQFNKLTTFVSGVRANEYQYLAILDTLTTSEGGMTSVHSTTIVRYSVDNNNKITSIEATPVSGTLRHVG